MATVPTQASGRISLVDAVPLAMPLVVHLEVTNRCNFACQYCPESLPDYGERVGGFELMSFDQFVTIADKIRAHGPVKVLRLWIMGEPLVNRDIFAMITYAKDPKNLVAERVEITTNGSLLSRLNVGKLLASGVDSVRISIYGFGNKQHEITQSRISSDKIQANVERLVNARDEGAYSTQVVIKMVDPDEEGEIQTFRDIYGPLADELVINVPHSWTDPYGVSTFEASDPRVSIVERRKSVREKRVCGFPFYTLAIHVNGDVGLCCVDWEKETKLGNVSTQSVGAIWNGPALHQVRRAHLAGERDSLPGCSGCDYFFDNCPEDLDSNAEELLMRFSKLAP